MDRLLSAKEFADRIHLKVRTVWRLIRENVIPARIVKYGGRNIYRLDEASYQAFLKWKTRPANKIARDTYGEYTTVR